MEGNTANYVKLCGAQTTDFNKTDFRDQDRNKLIFTYNQKGFKSEDKKLVALI